MSIYLDYNASTPIDDRVLEVMVNVYKNKYGNADSRTHDFGEAARLVVENSRQSVADILGINKDEVFFTSGATESDNIAILGLKDYAVKTNKKHIITTAIEHKAVLEPLQILEKEGFRVTYIKPDTDGAIRVEDVIENIDDHTLLVSVMHANNETGVIQPVKEIGEILSNSDILFHIDAAQSFGKLVSELRNTKYNMLSASAHKMYGPQGIGTLVLKKKKYKLPPVKPIMHGGSQEHGFRPGTVPTALIAGFGKACEIASIEYKANLVQYANNKKALISLLDDSGIKYEINGSQEFCMPNTINISFDGINSEALMLATRYLYAVSNGSACNSNSYKPSHVLSAMNMIIDRIESSIRMSWGTNSNTLDDFYKFIEIVKKL